MANLAADLLTPFIYLSIIMLNILILCTGNSARSILAECVFNHLGQGRVRAWSAGSHPTGKVNPFALQALQQAGIGCENVSSKSWDSFAQADAPALDLVITVCDNAANEVCPIFQAKGQHPAKAHWPYPDPAAVEGSDADKLAAFTNTLAQLQDRISRLLQQDLNTPLAALEPAQLAACVNAVPRQA